MTKFSIICISKTKKLLSEFFFVYDLFSSSPITGDFLQTYFRINLHIILGTCTCTCYKQITVDKNVHLGMYFRFNILKFDYR
jgi:hypothetical protein